METAVLSMQPAARAYDTSSSTPADESLMVQVRSGQAGALAELFERHHRSVFGFFHRMTGNREMSEDLVQDVFLRILRYRETYDPRLSFSAWMYGIARNAFIDVMRKRRPEAAWDDQLGESRSPEAPVDERLRVQQETALLQRALLELPADKREVLVLSRYQDLRYEEIGRILGCEPNAVKQRVFRAVRALGEQFERLTGGAS